MTEANQQFFLPSHSTVLGDSRNVQAEHEIPCLTAISILTGCLL
jgi:hypothetical protein